MRIHVRVVIPTLVLVLVLLKIALTLAPAWAAEYKVGDIETGSWARYEYYYDIQRRNYTDPKSPEQFYVVGDQTGEGHVEVKVESIFSVFVELSVTRHLENETRTESKSGDVRTGEGLDFYLIAGGLGQGDLIIESEDAPAIGRNLEVVYCNATREVNQAEFERTTEIGEGAYQIRWDKRTGFLCEMMTYTTTLVDGTEEYMVVDNLFVKLVILETNLWAPEETNEIDWFGVAIGIVFGLAVIGVLVTAVLLVRK